MPPKIKLCKSKGKDKPVIQGESCEVPNLALTPELEQKFESELCWCIQQLQMGLKSGKLSEKQVQDHRKTLNVLMNNSSSIVRKRQVMRLCFGDYRAKMEAENKRLSKVVANIKISPITPSKKSTFLKKSQRSNDVAKELSRISIGSTNGYNNTDTLFDFKFISSSNNFKFNFETENKLNK